MNTTTTTTPDSGEYPATPRLTAADLRRLVDAAAKRAVTGADRGLVKEARAYLGWYEAHRVDYWTVANACLALREIATREEWRTVASKSSPGKTYRVRVDGGACTCDGFRYRGTCSHCAAMKGTP